MLSGLKGTCTFCCLYWLLSIWAHQYKVFLNNVSNHKWVQKTFQGDIWKPFMRYSFFSKTFHQKTLHTDKQTCFENCNYLHKGTLRYILYLFKVHIVFASRYILYLHPGSYCICSRYILYLHQGTYCNYIKVHIVFASRYILYLFKVHIVFV